MRVSTLIELLQKLPPDAEVFAYDDGMTREIHREGVKCESLVLDYAKDRGEVQAVGL